MGSFFLALTRSFPLCSFLFEYDYIPHEAFPLLCFLTTLLELPDSYTVKTKAYSYALYVYMSAQPLPTRASGMGIDDTKITLLP